MTEVTRKAPGQETGKRKRRPIGRPRVDGSIVPDSEQISALRDKLGLPVEIHTYRDAARFLSLRAGKRIGMGTIYQFCNGEEPKNANLRRALGLPAIVPVEVCPSCGVVHVRKCPKSASPRKPRRNVRKIVMACLGLPW